LSPITGGDKTYNTTYSKKEFSTSALAKELKKDSQELFQQLFGLGLIIRNGNNWDLTPDGKSKGGAYRNHEKYGRYIVWPESLKAELETKQSDHENILLTSTSLGKNFEISATRTNNILSELGLIKKGIKGWEVTEFGKKLGGIQYHVKSSGAPYVCWPESIKTNKMLAANIREVKGEIPTVEQNLAQIKTSETVEFRDKFKASFRATDGHYVRSKAEMLIDNWLYMSELVHAYERKLPVEEEVYSDFYLPSGKIYIEYWGFDEDTKYMFRKEEKLAIYIKYDFHLIQLTDKEVQNLDDYLPKYLLGFGVRTD
jgi:hypothetical protein